MTYIYNIFHFYAECCHEEYGSFCILLVKLLLSDVYIIYMPNNTF